MAAPVTHIALTNKIFHEHFLHFERRKFFIGTSFPDIRYLNAIGRDTTHFNNEILDLESLNQKNSFMAGAKFHAIVDAIRERYIVANNAYAFLPKSKYATQSLKLLEDELLYERIGNWRQIIKDFENIPFEQIEFKLNRQQIEEWYRLLREYLSVKPNHKTRLNFITRIGFKVEVANEINDCIDKSIGNTEIRDVIFKLFE